MNFLGLAKNSSTCFSLQVTYYFFYFLKNNKWWGWEERWWWWHFCTLLFPFHFQFSFMVNWTCAVVHTLTHLQFQTFLHAISAHKPILFMIIQSSVKEKVATGNKNWSCYTIFFFFQIANLLPFPLLVRVWAIHTCTFLVSMSNTQMHIPCKWYFFSLLLVGWQKRKKNKKVVEF